MLPADWKNSATVAQFHGLSGAQWAWEFLRRSSEYQQQWQAFIGTWRELESVYGKAPNRDFCAWKLDSRAWVSVAECEAGDCRIDQDKVLIECAMGARWGFYKFPPDPQLDDAVGKGMLTWRELDDDQQRMATLTEGVGIADAAGQQLSFDLSLPLKAQLDLAKRQLQLEQRLRVKRDGLKLQRVSLLQDEWIEYLRQLDGVTDADVIAAQEMVSGGYLQLPWLPK